MRRKGKSPMTMKPISCFAGHIGVRGPTRSRRPMHNRAARIIVVQALACLFCSAGFQPASAAAATTQPTTKPILQSDDGVILLHSKDVIIHGTTVRYEPQPNKNTVGYWTKRDDWVSWDFVVEKAGKFEVIALQGCGKGS